MYTRKRSTCSGGYEYRFVNSPPERVVCVICKKPSKDPHLTECCGHIFCLSCVDASKASTASCPMCKDESFVTFSNKQVDREVKSLHVYCICKRKGCKWEGALSDVNCHVKNADGCQFEVAACSNGCGRMIQRRHLSNHIQSSCPYRQVNCKYCHDLGMHHFISGPHMSRCPKLPIRCPKKCCDTVFPRDEMEMHRKDCPMEVVQCDYYSLGCEAKIIRKRKLKHDEKNVEKHLQYTKDKLAKTEDRLENVEKMLQQLISYGKASLNQLGNSAATVNQLMSNSTVSTGGQVVISTTWSMHLYTMASMCAWICPITVKMSQFAELETQKIRWQSPPFYTQNEGYKVHLLLYANGIGGGKDTHLSIYLCLARGLHDDALMWPMNGKFEIKLLNQLSDDFHRSLILCFDERAAIDNRSRVVDIDTKQTAPGWGFATFITKDELKESSTKLQYLKDDCIFVQVRVL